MRTYPRGRGWGGVAALPLAVFALVIGRGALPVGNGPPPRRHVIEIRGMAFQPAVLEVAPGDTVVWVNRDLVPHTATAGDGGWDTGLLAQGDSSRYVARQTGETPYVCTLHPTMRGTLTVTGSTPEEETRR